MVEGEEFAERLAAIRKGRFGFRNPTVSGGCPAKAGGRMPPAQGLLCVL